jgi:hypothetical protein
VEEKGEVTIEPTTKRMYLMFNGGNRPVENTIREVLQPVLFPDIPLTKSEGIPEYYTSVGDSDPTPK